MTMLLPRLQRPALGTIRRGCDVTAGPSLAARHDNTAGPLLEVVRRAPERTAVVFGDTVLSYARFNATVNRVARVLTEHGAGPGTAVAYLLPNCPEILELFYALQKIGAVAVPLNARSTGCEIACLVKTSGAPVLVFADVYGDRVAAALPQLTGVRDLLCVDGPFDRPAGTTVAGIPAARTVAVERAVSLTSAQRATCAEEPVMLHDPQAVARIQFTGGSTGVPKGVERTHRADLVVAEGVGLSNGLYADPNRVVLIECPLEHHGGHSWFTMAVALGATLVLCPGFDPDTIIGLIERWRVSHMILLPPATCARLVRHPGIEQADLSSVQVVQSAAGGTDDGLIERICELFEHAVFNYGWGQTESGLGSSLALTGQMVREQLARTHSVGTPMPFIEMRIVDDAGNPLPDGVPGECVVRSAAVMRGYHNRPDATAQAFTADGWLRTGDIMTRDRDGFLTMNSRRRELIKSGGENVFIGEVEAVVRSHPGVADCLVYGVPDERFGEAVAVAVELVDGKELSLEELQEHCRGHLASFKKPRELHVLGSLGRDGAGKVNLDQLLRRINHRSPN